MMRRASIAIARLDGEVIAITVFVDGREVAFAMTRRGAASLASRITEALAESV